MYCIFFFPPLLLFFFGGGGKNAFCPPPPTLPAPMLITKVGEHLADYFPGPVGVCSDRSGGKGYVVQWRKSVLRSGGGGGGGMIAIWR